MMIKGYKKLTDNQKKIFDETYKKHQSCLGDKLKEQYTPVSVKELGTKLKVIFKNGEWLHYTSNHEWY